MQAAGTPTPECSHIWCSYNRHLFSLQLDESTLCGNEALLLAFKSN